MADMKSRQVKYGAYAGSYTLIVLAVLGLLNWLAKDHNKSFDSTTNKQFSLSDQTVKTVKGLSHDVNLTYFDQQTRFSTARGLLDRYANLSSRLHVAYVDPDKKPDIAKASGFRTLGSVIVQAGTRTEEALSLSEEGVTNAIVRSMKTGTKVVCFVNGSGEATLEDNDRSGLSAAKDQLEKSTYKTQSISLVDNQKIPADCSAVIIAGPRRDYSEAAGAALKTYVADGGHLLIALDPPISAQRGTESIGDAPVLAKILQDWGVTANKDVIIDSRGQVMPMVSSYESHPIVRDLSHYATVFPLSRSLTLASGKGVEKLFSTSANTASTTNLKPPISPESATGRGPFVLAAAGTVGTGAKQGRFVVVGGSTWMTNSILTLSQLANRDLFLNTVNWLAADEDLISIRPKDPEDRRISLNGNQSLVLFLVSIVLLPMAVILTGIAAWWKRR